MLISKEIFSKGVLFPAAFKSMKKVNNKIWKIDITKIPFDNFNFNLSYLLWKRMPKSFQENYDLKDTKVPKECQWSWKKEFPSPPSLTV